MDKKEFYELLKEGSKDRYGKKYPHSHYPSGPIGGPGGPTIYYLTKIVMKKAGEKSSKRWR